MGRICWTLQDHPDAGRAYTLIGQKFKALDSDGPIAMLDFLDEDECDLETHFQVRA